MQLPSAITTVDAKTVLFVVLSLVTIAYLTVLVRGLKREREITGQSVTPTPGGLATGFVTNFFDTLGIGSFATTTAIFRQWKMVRDEKVPGTLNVGHTLPTIVQAFIYTRLVPVESTTLIGMICAAVLGSWLGAGVVSRWPRQRIQLGMGLCLLGAAALMLSAQLNIVPAGGELLGLHGPLFLLGLLGNFVLGALMSVGIGLYGPCLILISLLGMDPKAAFPIMMGSCAFLMPIGSARFIRERAFDARACLGLFIGGLPAVFIAAFLVKALPFPAVRWLVVIVVTYTAAMLLRSALLEKNAASTAVDGETVTL